MPDTDLNSIIAEHAPILAAKLLDAANKGRLEIDLILEADVWLREFADAAGIHWHPQGERRVVFHEADKEGKRHAIIDRLFNQVVVEFEKPLSLYPSNEAPANKHAVKQVQEQITGLVHKEGWLEDKVSGVVLDGRFFIFVRMTSGRWIVEAPLAVDEHSTSRFLRLLASLSREPMLPKAIVERFGIKQKQPTIMTVRELFEGITSPSTKRAEALFTQWKVFYGEVAGLDATRLAGKKEINQFVYDVLGKKSVSAEELERLLFALYTYAALLVKLIAVVAVTPFFAKKVSEPLSAIAGLSDSESASLRQRLRSIESGQWFRELGIMNLCEGDFFGWYLDEWTPGIVRQVKRLVDLLAEYDPAAVEQTPERARDLMKAIYHGLLPRDVRKVLGEYYTPDWLAEHLLMQMDQDIWDELEGVGRERKLTRYRDILPKLTSTSWLDPTCGSGTFLVLILNKIKAQWRNARSVTDDAGNPIPGVPSKKELLEALKRNVWGFDLNPVAVISARANWLLSTVDLMEEGDQIEIPVYLADSVALPATSQEDVFSDGVYLLPMRGIGKDFPVPASFAEDPSRLIALAGKLEQDVRVPIPTEKFLAECEAMFGLQSAVWGRSKKSLKELYETLCDLERNEMNGLWAGVAKNMFMPLFIEKFQYVVGNPPWVNWENLPTAYRKSLGEVCKPYELFPHTGYDAILGKSKDDISSMVAYVASDLYLKNRGKLGFVITQSVFKTSGAGNGFRRFKIKSDTPVQVLAVDDFTSFQPFEGVTNRTATFIWLKGAHTRYPINTYTVWRRTGSKKPDFWMDWKAAEPLLKRTVVSAEPVVKDDLASAWLTGPKDILIGIRKALGKTGYQARAGAYSGGLNPVFWLEVLRKNSDGTVEVRMITEGAKTEVPPPYRYTIEPDLLYPLLRGRDVKRWSAVPAENTCFLLTHRPEAKLNAIPESEMKAEYPRLDAYLKRHEKQLRKRAAYKRYFKDTAPFYSMFDIGEYTFAPYKVVWPWISRDLAVAVVEGRNEIPEHNVLFFPCQSPEEAHYLAAVLNSSPARSVLDALCSGGGGGIAAPGSIERLSLPILDQNKSSHLTLAALSREAHDVTAGKPGRSIGMIEQEIDEMAAKLWGITPKELDAIQKALREK